MKQIYQKHDQVNFIGYVNVQNIYNDELHLFSILKPQGWRKVNWSHTIVMSLQGCKLAEFNSSHYPMNLQFIYCPIFIFLVPFSNQEASGNHLQWPS